MANGKPPIMEDMTMMSFRSAAVACAMAGATLTTTITLAAPNLVQNGDFEAGNTGFTSAYRYTPGGNSAEGQYTVATNTFPWNPAFAASGDHGSGTGSMFVGNGSPLAGQIVWQSGAISISAATDYFFEAYLLNACCFAGYAEANSAPILTFGIALDGSAPVPLDTLTIPLSPAGVWNGLSTGFNSGSATSAVLSLINANTAIGGNDFAVDDIYLGTRSTVTAVPEPATWAMLVGGFGLIGSVMRKKRITAPSAA